MKIRLTTEVDGHYTEVMSRFDKKLFEALKPKFGKMEVLEFTGSEKGDVVRLRFISPIKACLLYTSPSPRDQRGSRMPSSA